MASRRLEDIDVRQTVTPFVGKQQTFFYIDKSWSPLALDGLSEARSGWV